MQPNKQTEKQSFRQTNWDIQIGAIVSYYTVQYAALISSFISNSFLRSVSESEGFVCLFVDFFFSFSYFFFFFFFFVASLIKNLKVRK